MYMPMLKHYVYVLESIACIPSLTFSSFGSSFWVFFFSWICMACRSFKGGLCLVLSYNTIL